ncbi:hypothetical protein [Nocardioides alkalitolerans]|nr:hypothetical protein [Nocardioides alkalitolerans]
MKTTSIQYCPTCDRQTRHGRIVEKNFGGEIFVDITTCEDCGRDS